MNWNEYISKYWPQLLAGTVTTIELFVLSSLLSIILASVFGALKASNIKLLRWISFGYIEFFRGTSLLVQIYWIYFVLPVIGFSLSSFSAGVIAIGLNAGAYGAELVYGAIRAVPKGQWEASHALSLSPSRVLWRIIFPQALIIMIPSWGNLFIDILKSTALVSLISVTEIMFVSNAINADTYKSIQIFGTALIIYYVLARFLVTPAIRSLERRLRSKTSRK